MKLPRRYEKEFVHVVVVLMALHYVASVRCSVLNNHKLKIETGWYEKYF